MKNTNGKCRLNAQTIILTASFTRLGSQASLKAALNIRRCPVACKGQEPWFCQALGWMSWRYLIATVVASAESSAQMLASWKGQDLQLQVRGWFMLCLTASVFWVQGGGEDLTRDNQQLLWVESGKLSVQENRSGSSDPGRSCCCPRYATEHTTLLGVGVPELMPGALPWVYLCPLDIQTKGCLEIKPHPKVFFWSRRLLMASHYRTDLSQDLSSNLY